MIRAEGYRAIRAPVQRVWQLLSRIESHPRFTGIWMAADVRERSPTAPLVEFRGFFGGLPITSVQRFSLRSPGRIEFKQVRGTLLEFSGAYTVGESDGATVLAAQVAVDPGITLFSEAAVRQILAGHIESTLVKARSLAERDLARPQARRHQASVTGAPPGEEEVSGEVAPETEGGLEEAAEPPEAPVTPAAARPAEASGKRRRRRRRRKQDH